MLSPRRSKSKRQHDEGRQQSGKQTLRKRFQMKESQTISSLSFGLRPMPTRTQSYPRLPAEFVTCCCRVFVHANPPVCIPPSKSMRILSPCLNKRNQSSHALRRPRSLVDTCPCFTHMWPVPSIPTDLRGLVVVSRLCTLTVPGHPVQVIAHRKERGRSMPEAADAAP
jgi:hypothetical protein